MADGLITAVSVCDVGNKLAGIAVSVHIFKTFLELLGREIYVGVQHEMIVDILSQ